MYGPFSSATTQLSIKQKLAYINAKKLEANTQDKTSEQYKRDQHEKYNCAQCTEFIKELRRFDAFAATRRFCSDDINKINNSSDSYDTDPDMPYLEENYDFIWPGPDTYFPAEVHGHDFRLNNNNEYVAFVSVHNRPRIEIKITCRKCFVLLNRIHQHILPCDIALSSIKAYFPKG